MGDWVTVKASRVLLYWWSLTFLTLFQLLNNVCGTFCLSLGSNLWYVWPWYRNLVLFSRFSPLALETRLSSPWFLTLFLSWISFTSRLYLYISCPSWETWPWLSIAYLLGRLAGFPWLWNSYPLLLNLAVDVQLERAWILFFDSR